MKTINNIKTYLIVALLTFGLFSCQKEDVSLDQSSNSVLQEEGFKSKTGNSDSFIGNEETEATPVLHMSYDGSLSKEDVDARFDAEVDRFIKESQKSNFGASECKEFYFRVKTLTGKGKKHGTDGKVMVKVEFQTNDGFFTVLRSLNNPWDDREPNQIDNYLIKVRKSKKIEWLKAKSAKLYLKGKDGWYVKEFNVYIEKDYQCAPVKGGSYMFSKPNLWLDSKTEDDWDIYDTGEKGVGKLTFL